MDGVLRAVSNGNVIAGGVLTFLAAHEHIEVKFQLARADGIPDAVIKGICDWSVARNVLFPENPLKEETFKDSLQAYAMLQVMNACNALFRNPQLFAHHKNEDLKELIRSYTLCRICLSFCTIIMFTYGIQRLWASCVSPLSESPV